MKSYSPTQLLILGYDQTQKEHLENGQAMDGVLQMDDKNKRELTPYEKIANGFNSDSTQKQKEVSVLPNEEGKAKAKEDDKTEDKE